MGSRGPSQHRPSVMWRRVQTTAKDREEHWQQSALVRRLKAGDVINRGMLFAAVLFLCFVPFLLVVQSVVGRSGSAGFIERFGLTPQAAHAVRQTFTSPASTAAAVDGLSWAFVILGGIAAAAAIQELYERVFEVDRRGLRHLARQLLWLAGVLGATFIGGLTQPWLRSVGGPALVDLFSFFGATAFWWFSMRLLLGGRRAWRELFPSALATGIFWLGMVIAFELTISSIITSDYNKYGAIGVVFVFMSLLIAIGVVIVLGAVVGLVWQERKKSRGRLGLR